MIKIIKLFTFLSLSVILTSCNLGDKNEPLLISSNTWIGYESLYITEKLDLMKGGIKVIRKQNATDVMALFEQGEVDVAGLTLDEAMIVMSHGTPLYFASVMDISNGADQLRVTPEIQSLKDLKGKNIGVEMTALGQLVLASVLTDAALTQNDITIVNSTVDQHLALIKDGSIDAAITFPPFSDGLSELGLSKLYDSTQMQRSPIIDVLVISENALKNKKEKIEELVNHLYTVNKMLVDKDPIAIKIAGENLGIPEDMRMNMTEGVELVSKGLNTTYISRYKLEATMLTLEDVMLQNQLLDKAISDQITPNMFVRF